MGEGYGLLVIDDEQYAVEGITQAIDWKSVGISKVYGANSVNEAKEIMRRCPVDVIICDIEMPGENGLEFLKWLKEELYSSRLIFLTGYARFEYAKEAIGLGAADFLLKPIDHDALKELVAEVLRQYEEDVSLQKKAKEYEKYRKLLNEDGDIVVLDSEHVAVLFYRPENCREERLEKFAERAVKEVGCELESFVCLDVPYTEIHTAYQKLRATEDRKSFSDRHIIWNLEDLEKEELIFPDMEVLLALMEMGKRKELEQEVAKFLAQAEGFSPDIREKLRVMYYRMISAAITVLHAHGSDMNQELHRKLFDERVCDSPKVFAAWAKELISYTVPDFSNNKIAALIKAVKDYVKEHIESDLSRESIANEVFLNPSYLSRVFHKETGEKLTDYIVRKRVEHAKWVLSNTDEKISLIAERLGYHNDSYFIKIFKNLTGMTPFEYRKEVRGKERG